MIATRFCTLSLLSVAVGAVLAGPAAAADKGEEVSRLVEQLKKGGEARTKARTRLIALGASALPALRKLEADRHLDPDMRLRLGLIARDIKEGLFREVRRFEGHTGAVRNLALSRDGSRLLSCSGWPKSDYTIRLWDVATGKEIRKLAGHTSAIESVAFSPDGKRALSSGYDQSVRLWDLHTGKEVRRFNHPGNVYSVVFLPDGKHFLTACQHVLRLWEVEGDKEERRFEGHTADVVYVTVSADGKQAASCGNDNTVRLWDVATGKELHCLKGHTQMVHAGTFAPDGKTLASASYDRTVRLWDVATGKELRQLKGHENGVRGVAFSPDGKRLATVSEDTTVRLWETATGKELYSYAGHTQMVTGVAFTPDGRHIVSGGGGSRAGQGKLDAALRLWSAPAAE